VENIRFRNLSSRVLSILISSSSGSIIILQVLENSSVTSKTHNKKGISFEEFYHKKHAKEERLDLQNTDDLTSLSPLNEETGLISSVCASWEHVDTQYHFYMLDSKNLFHVDCTFYAT